MNKLVKDGDTVSHDYGHLTIKATLVDGGISLYVSNAGGRIASLTKLLARDEAAAYYRFLRDAALADTPIWLIEAQATALMTAAQATGEADAELAASINATMDAAQPTPVDVSDILDTPADSWAAFRQQATVTAATTTEPMDHILAVAARNNGLINRGGNTGEATSTQLVALRKRGLVELVHTKHGNRRDLTGGRLTAKGWKRAGVEQGQVAA